jgi:hypothetical protein
MERHFLSVFISVNPWFNSFGCGSAALGSLRFAVISIAFLVDISAL